MGDAEKPTRNVLCPGCSATVARRPGRGRPRKYCCDSCYARHRRNLNLPAEPRRCRVCAVPFLPDRSTQTLCSKACKRRAQKIYYREWYLRRGGRPNRKKEPREQ